MTGTIPSGPNSGNREHDMLMSQGSRNPPRQKKQTRKSWPALKNVVAFVMDFLHLFHCPPVVSGTMPGAMTITLSIKTERLLLRSVRPTDSGRIQELLAHPEVLAPLTHVSFPLQSNAGVRIANLPHNMPSGTHRRIFAIADPSDKNIFGLVGMVYDQMQTVSTIGYWLGRPYWGLGLATEAVKSLLHYGLSSLGISAVIANSRIDNPSSLAVLDRSGFMRFSERTKAIPRDGTMVQTVDCIVFNSSQSSSGASRESVSPFRPTAALLSPDALPSMKCIIQAGHGDSNLADFLERIACGTAFAYTFQISGRSGSDGVLVACEKDIHDAWHIAAIIPEATAGSDRALSTAISVAVSRIFLLAEAPLISAHAAMVPAIRCAGFTISSDGPGGDCPAETVFIQPACRLAAVGN